MQLKNKKLFTRGIAILFAFLALDQASKYYLLHILKIYEIGQIEVTSFFNLVMVWNRGMSFGMFNQFEHSIIILSVIAIIISSYLLYWLAKTESKIEAIALPLIVSGAIGNVIDRVLYKAVADFFDFHIFGYHWPAFNVADSCIFIGAMLLIISIIKTDNKTI
jgi:signal peptidase II